MKDLEREIDEIIDSANAYNASLQSENIIYSFSCRFSLEKVTFKDSEGYSDHSYQLDAQLYRDTVLISYRCGQHNETIPSHTYQSIVDKSVMKEIEQIINDSDVRKYNGMHRTTQGLPEGYGCALEVRYLFGEGISLSNNSFLYFDVDFIQKLIRLFYRASGAMSFESSYRLNGVSYSIFRGGLCRFQAYLLLNQDDTVSLEYYDRQNFRSLKCKLDEGILNELDQLWQENDLDYAGKPTAEEITDGVFLDMRYGRSCRSASTNCPLTDMQITALENVREIIEEHLQDK